MDITVSEGESPRYYCESFNSEDADVTYASSDGVYFKIHSVFLKAHSGVLSPPGGSDFEQVVQLTETAQCLEILFAFLYPRRQPDPQVDFGFDVLMDVAEGAEKYRVFPAIYACYVRIRENLPDHVAVVLGYSLKHGHQSLANEAAAHALDHPVAEVIRSIPSQFCEAWLRYYDSWREIQMLALTGQLASNLNLQVMMSLAGSLRAFQGLSTNDSDPWKSTVARAIHNRITTKLFVPESQGLREKETETPVLSREFSFECQDGQRVFFDSTHLKHCAPDFLRSCSVNNKVKIDGDSDIIRILLQSVQPTTFPDLLQLDFGKLKDLAYLAEKLFFYQVMGVCKSVIKSRLPSNAEDIFRYAAQFGYYDILAKAAPEVLHLSFDSAAFLPPPIFKPWILYYNQWLNLSQKVALFLIEAQKTIKYRPYSTYTAGTCTCDSSFPFSNHAAPVIAKILAEPALLKNLDICLPRTSPCGDPEPNKVFAACRQMVEEEVKKIQPLEYFLSHEQHQI